MHHSWKNHNFAGIANVFNPMKKTRFKPQESQQNDFSIFVITTAMADYKLAFELNRQLGLNLAKQKDLPVYLSEQKQAKLPFFWFQNDEQTDYYLIEDRTAGDAMMKGFLFFVKGYITQEYIAELPDSIGMIDDIFNCNFVSKKEKGRKTRASGKSDLIRNIITDLEYHMLEISRVKEEEKIKLKPTQKRSIRKLYN